MSNILEDFVKPSLSGTATDCRVCDASGRHKRPIVAHRRGPGRSGLNLMISLCPGCHSKVHRTKAVLSQMPSLLLQLWSEQHTTGHEQTALNFRTRGSAAVPIKLSGRDGGGN
jgi:hypothetical protein